MQQRNSADNKQIHTPETDQQQREAEQKVEDIVASVNTLSEESRQHLFKLLHPEEKEVKGECTCDDHKFPQDQREACVDAAIRYYQLALQANEEKKEKQHKQMLATKKTMKAMITKSMSGRRRKRYNSGANHMAEKIAEELVTIKDLKIQDIVHVIEGHARNINEKCRVTGSIIRNDQDSFNKLVELLEARKPVKIYLRKLIIDASDLRELNLERVWRERAAANGTNSDEAKKARESIEQLAQAANQYCASFFKPYMLHPEVEEANDFKRLSPIVKHTLPLTVDSWRMLISSVAKINMMHLVETIRSQVDFDQMKAASQHLEKFINARKKRLPDMRELFTCGDPNNTKAANSIVVESIRVAAEKKEESAARKYMDKGSENTKDYDAYNIKDWVRFRIMLTKKDSQDPERMRQATVKILSILTSLFGTDVIQERLRYAFENGGTNTNSTGKHEAFHITMRYRYQCGNGEIWTIPVEIQIQKYMDSMDSAEDHDDYVQKKDRKNTRIAGMDVTFYQFITDLCDFILSDYETVTQAEFCEDSMRRPEKEQIALILFMIITKRNQDGELENSKILREIFENEMQRAKVQKIVEIYKEYVSHVQRRKDPYPHANRKMVTGINKLALEVETIFEEMETLHSCRRP